MPREGAELQLKRCHLPPPAVTWDGAAMRHKHGARCGDATSATVDAPEHHAGLYRLCERSPIVPKGRPAT